MAAPRYVHPDKLLRVAIDSLATARGSDLAKSKSELEIDGVRVEVTVARDYEHDEENGSSTVERSDEQVTVKTGPASRPEIVVAMPGKWLDAMKKPTPLLPR